MAGSQDRFCLMVKGTTNCPQNMILNPLRRRYSFIRNLLTPLHRSLHPLATKPPKSIHNSTNTPYSTCFPHLLPLCIKFEHLKPLKATLIVHGLFTNKPLLGEFLKHCFHLGAPDLALSTFDKIHKPSVFLQNFVVRCLCDNELYEDVLGVYARCQILGCGSDNYTFPFVIKACAALGAFQIGREVHCAVLRSGFGDNVVIQTGLVDFYAKNGRLESARLLHDKMLEPDLVSWNALISGYSLHGFHEDVFKLCRTIGVAGLKPNVSTLASVIPMCSRSGYVLIGKSLHGLAFKCGYSMDECLTPALISMYASIGDLSVSRCMFDCLEKKNVAVWNAMISAYAQNRESADAFELFRKMPRDDVQRNVITFVSIIPCSEDLGSTLHGESVHACIIKEGLENQLSVVTALLSMYGKLGDLYSAKFLFDQMPHRNLLTWNSIVSAYVHNGLYDASLAAFRELQFAGFDPDMISIVSILSSCSKLKANFLGKSVHAYCLMWGIDVNLNVSNALLAFYSDCCMLTSAISLFRRMEVRNVISWNTLISGCAHNRDVENAVILLQRLQQEGLELDSVSLISVLPCFNETENLVQGMAIHGYATKAGLAFDVSLANALISMYLNCGELDAGKLVFVDMPIRSVISWNALITGYRCRGLQNEVMALLGQMVKDNQKPNHVTLLNVVPVCDTYLQGKSVHAYAVRTGTILETPLLTSLILMYARFENIDSCLSLFEMGEKSNITLWNAIISAHVQSKNPKIALSFFCDLLRMAMGPDYVTILSLVSACVQLNNSNLTNSLMALVIHLGFDKDVAITNAFMDLFARCGNISCTSQLFDRSLIKDSISWSIMISAYGLHGDGEAALGLLSQMRLSGLKPDDITYVSILSACSHTGLVEQGRKVFNSMVEHGVSPRMEHYACIVDLLGRTGHLSEAFTIVKNMPCKSSVSLLDSLLGSCLIHGNVELGEEIGRLLLEMDPENSGPYVILYNIYAAAGRWTDANTVRSDMEGKQLIKVRGFSYVGGYQISS